MKLSQVIGFNMVSWLQHGVLAPGKLRLWRKLRASNPPRLGRELEAEPRLRKKPTTTVLCNHALDDMPYPPQNNFMDQAD